MEGNFGRLIVYNTQCTTPAHAQRAQHAAWPCPIALNDVSFFWFLHLEDTQSTITRKCAHSKHFVLHATATHFKEREDKLCEVWRDFEQYY